MKINAEKFMDAMAKAELQVRSYSGRGMYGANCVGVDVQNMGEVGLIALALVDAGIESCDVADFMVKMQWDNMGRDYIVYWPYALKLDDEQHAALMAAEYAHDGEDEDEE